MKKHNTLALAGLALLGSTMIAAADPISLAPVVTDLKAQAGSIITEGLPLLAVILGGALVWKMAKKFFK